MSLISKLLHNLCSSCFYIKTNCIVVSQINVDTNAEYPSGIPMSYNEWLAQNPL